MTPEYIQFKDGEYTIGVHECFVEVLKNGKHIRTFNRESFWGMLTTRLAELENHMQREVRKRVDQAIADHVNNTGV